MRDINLKVTSHVGRDLLASAASFKTEQAVIWEYVVNSLQYVDEGATPSVQVFVNQREHRVEIRDNGRGMGDQDLFGTRHDVLELKSAQRREGDAIADDLDLLD